MAIRCSNADKTLSQTSYSFSRLWAIAAVLALTTVLTACSFSLIQLAYNQAHNYVYWRTNRAFSLEKPQQAVAKATIRDWFAWHRSTQLPIYAQFLTQTQIDAAGDITPALACKRRDEMEVWMKNAVDHIAPQLAKLAVTLGPRQLNNLEEHFQDMNEDFTDDFLQKDPAERREALDDFATKWIELFYGRFSSEQRKQLSEDIAHLPLDASTFYQLRLRFQTKLIALLRQIQTQKETVAQAEPQLRALMMDLVDPQDPKFRLEWQRWITAGCQMSASVHNRTTPTQRQHVIDVFKGWQPDLIELSKDTH